LIAEDEAAIARNSDIWHARQCTVSLEQVERVMATWQFDLKAVDGNAGTLLPTPYQARVESFLEGLMDRSVEAGGWVMYGPADGNRIDLAFDEDGCELDVRIDARTEADSFISLVCVLMSQQGCTLYSPEQDAAIPADVHSVKAALQRSGAWMYALDAQAFLTTKTQANGSA
jgi:hypothetical protein